MRAPSRQRGVLALWAVVLLPVVILMLALVIESAYLFASRRAQQLATDYAARAAALQKLRGDSAGIGAAARQSAAANGFAVDGDTTVLVESPPLAGSWAGDERAVKVQINDQPPRLFPALFVGAATAVGTRATALLRRPVCLLALAASGNSTLSIDANANVPGPYCAAQVNSSGVTALRANNNAVVSLQSIRVRGGVSISGSATVSPTPVTGAATIADPLLAISEPAFTACDFTNYVANGTVTLQPGTYCNGIRLNANARVTLGSGNYVIYGGGLDARNNSRLTGSAVTIFVVLNGSLAINSTAILNLTAPTNGTYAGIVIFESRSVPLGVASHSIPIAATGRVEGVVYTPRSALQVTGVGSQPANGSAQALALIANTLRLTGRLRINYDPHFVADQLRQGVWLAE